MTRRPGLTLMEVMVTLFILAFGVMAILTLFPLAASQMFIAVREDRSALAANAADGFFRAYWKSEVVDRKRDGQTPADEFYTALDDPGSGATPARTGLNPPADDEASYPVVIDPMGWAAGRGTWLGDSGGTTNVPRRSLRTATVTNAGNQQFPLRLCSLMDGFGYDAYGVPTADRELRYNWLWVVQRVPNRNKSAAHLTVVVFDNRPHLYTPPGGAEVVVENVTVNPNTTSVEFPGLPDIKPGAWVMDATVGTATSTVSKVRQAHFYQAVSVTPDAVNNKTVLELQRPLRTPSDNNATPYLGTFVILRGVSGVSVRAPLSAE